MAITTDISSGLLIFRGDTVDVLFALKDPDGFPIDLTDRTVMFGAKEAVDKDTYIFRVDCEITDATAGKCTAHLTDVETDPKVRDRKLFDAGQAAVSLFGEVLILVTATREQRTAQQFRVTLTRDVIL